MKIVLSKSNIEIYLLALIYLIMWFPMQDIPFIGFMDEILTLFLFFLLILKLKVSRDNYILIFSILGFLFIGVISSITSGVPQATIARLLDFFALIKLPTVFLYFRYIFLNKQAKKFTSILFFLSRIVVSVSFIFAIANLFFDFGMSYDFRYGIRSFEFFYHNPGSFVALMTVCFSIINAQEDKNNIFFKILIILNLFLTLRTVAFGIIVLILVLPFLIKSNLKLHHILIIIPFIVGAGYGAISNYFVKQVTPRSLLLKYGFTVAKRFFPFGSGFATYGSNAAHDYYSPLYYEFGFNNVWGLSPQVGHILNDNFWPMIVAQFGVIGLLLYLIFIFNIIKTLFDKSMCKKDVISCVVLLSFILLSSIGANVVTGVLGVLIIIPFTLIVNVSEWGKNE